MQTDYVYKVKDTYIDLSQIRTFRLNRYANETENRILEIQLKDRIHFFSKDHDDYKLIPEEEFQIIFDNGNTALKECNDLVKAWEEYISASLAP